MQLILIKYRICATSLILPKNQFAFAVEFTSITTTQLCNSDSQTLLRYVSILRRWFSNGFFFYKLFPILSGCFLFWFQKPLTKGQELQRTGSRELNVFSKNVWQPLLIIPNPISLWKNGLIHCLLKNTCGLIGNRNNI